MHFNLTELSDNFVYFQSSAANSLFNLLFLLRLLKLAYTGVSSAYTINLKNLLKKKSFI